MIRRDKQATMDKQFLDPRSYVANWKHPFTDHACEYLFGEDKTARRRQIFDRDKGKCQLETFLCKGYQGWDYGEWHHAKGGRGRQHCDCLENGLWSCGPCHRAMHVAVRSDKRPATA
jgi:hypothetical protein